MVDTQASNTCVERRGGSSPFMGTKLMEIMMKIHPTFIEGFETLEEAARAIGKLRYDALAVFLGYLSEELDEQRYKDMIVGKTKLAKDASELLQALGESEEAASVLFMLYKKFMKEELALTGEMRYYNPVAREHMKK